MMSRIQIGRTPLNANKYIQFILVVVDMGKKIKKAETSTHKPHQEHPDPHIDKKTLLTKGSEQQLALIKEIFQQITAEPETHVTSISLSSNS